METWFKPNGRVTTQVIAVVMTLGAAAQIASAQPTNDFFTNATLLASVPANATLSNVGATKEPGEPNHVNNPGGHSIWCRWTAPFTGRVIMNTAGSSFDTLLAVYRGTSVTNLTIVAANDDDPFAVDLETSRLWFDAAVGTDYRIAVDGWSGAAGTIQLQIAEPPRPPNDQFAQRTLLSGLTAQAFGNNTDATREPGEPFHAEVESARSIWWRWIAPSDGVTVVTTSGSDFDTLLAIYTGTNVAQLFASAANDQDPRGGNTSALTFDSAGGQECVIAVDGVANATGLVVLNLEHLPRPRLTALPGNTQGTVQLSLTGVIGRKYVIEATTQPANPAVWLPLLTNASLSSSTWEFSDADSYSHARRYYRAVLIP